MRSYISKKDIKTMLAVKHDIKIRTHANSKKDKQLTNQSSRFLKHDEFFNHKRKAAYETHLAELVITNITPFMSTVKKVSDIIIVDIKKMASDKRLHPDSISVKMRKFFLNDPDLQVLFGDYVYDPSLFFEKVIDSLENSDPHYFYHQMCIQRVYIIFFTEKGKAKPELHQARKEDWTTKVNLSLLLSDIITLRNDDVYFKNVRRLPRRHQIKKDTRNIGILPPDDYKKLPLEKRINLENRLPKHTSGMLEHIITTEGEFVASGMLDYDMPAACGPSGNTAMRLALANHAGLTQKEKELFAFVVSLYLVAIGAHTVDECFMIANMMNFSHYCRGDYDTIIPSAVITDVQFRSLRIGIQRLKVVL